MSFTSFKGKRSQFYQFGFIINAISKPLEEFLSSCQAFFWGGGKGGWEEGGTPEVTSPPTIYVYLKDVRHVSV